MKISHSTSLLCLSLTSLSFRAHLHPTLFPPCLPLSPCLSHPSPPPPPLCSIFSISLNYLLGCLLFPPSFSHLHLTLFVTISSDLFPSPLFSQPNVSLHFPALLYLPPSPHLLQQRAFSISAPLLQINDLICRNKQVSSTLSPVHFPLLLQTLQSASEK